ncbi:RluA family pseudouridine synthase [Moraxella nasibovis]|uniref:RluA family pseudouridine synthase n=1 Tax=Moraxella nasibovis TaxID=2904120 RepID=UPI00240FDF1F|nr:RluA family pseudouridine synthase [Moraxella nasibovis]WFF38460.1 RluA family pseudouridine synthase [Moraxella nasibovis]
MKKPSNSPKKSQNFRQNSATKPKSAHKAQSADDIISDFSRVNFLTVTANQDDQRIDNFLLARLKGLPRSHLYKLIRDDEIRVNKKRVKPHDRVYVGDVVRVAPVRLSVKDEPVVSERLAQGLLGRIVFENEGLIVLNKPHGMAVHGGSGESFGVIEAMRVATGKKYLELVHRIDKDTSGLLLIAKKRSVLKALQDQFREKTIKKSYLCLVAGHVKADKQTIDKPLLKYTLASGERRVKVHLEGKPSQTHIEVLARFEMNGEAVSLVRASPLTGRTHQIRVHMASIGHALLGDDKYLTTSAPAVPRLCLHAWQLTMMGDDEKTPNQFSADVPSDMANLFPKECEFLIACKKS